MKSNRTFISCLFICSVVVPISLLAQTVPLSSPISGSSEVCDDESTSYSVNTTLQIVINEIDYNGASGSDVIEIKNIGTTTVDIYSWWICSSAPSGIEYIPLSSLNIVNGSLNLSSGSLVSLDGLTFDITNNAAVGLIYTDGSESSREMRHFVKFGTTTSKVGREKVAVAAGLWTSPSSGQYDIVPTENGKTIEFDGSGIMSTDWSIATGSLGNENSVSTNYNWSVPTGAMISNNNGNSITINWSGAESGNVSVTETNGDGGVGSVNLAVTVNQLVAWYVDSDGDGFGDPNSTPVMSCDEIAGSASNDDDCDDNNAEVTIEQTWHRDVDGDGFGDPNDPTASCTQPVGFVLNGTDCDDNNDQVPASPTISILSGEPDYRAGWNSYMDPGWYNT